MPTSIRDGVQQLEVKLRAERAIAERFPDAVLRELTTDRMEWISASASGHTTDVELVNVKSDRPPPVPGLQNIYVYAYLTVEGMRVYAEPGSNNYHLVWLSWLRENRPEVYQVLVGAAQR